MEEAGRTIQVVTEARVPVGSLCPPGQPSTDSHPYPLEGDSEPRSEHHSLLSVNSPGRRLLEAAAPGDPHRHRSGPRLLQGHQESHHPRPAEEGGPRGLHPPAPGDWTQEIPSGASAKRAGAPRPAGRRGPTRGTRGAGPGAPAEAARGRRQALVVVLLHSAEPAQAALAAQVLGAAGCWSVPSAAIEPCPLIKVLYLLTLLLCEAPAGTNWTLAE